MRFVVVKLRAPRLRVGLPRKESAGQQRLRASRNPALGLLPLLVAHHFCGKILERFQNNHIRNYAALSVRLIGMYPARCLEDSVKHAFKTALSLLLSLSLVLSMLPAQALALTEESMGEEVPTARPMAQETSPSVDSEREELSDQSASTVGDQSAKLPVAPNTVEEGQMGEEPVTDGPDGGAQDVSDSDMTPQADSSDVTTVTDVADATAAADGEEMGIQSEGPALGVQNTGDDTWQTARTLTEGIRVNPRCCQM